MGDSLNTKKGNAAIRPGARCGFRMMMIGESILVDDLGRHRVAERCAAHFIIMMDQSNGHETADLAAKAVNLAAPGASERVDEPNVLADLGVGSHFRAIAAVTALRNAVRLNALFSVVSGSICFVFAGWVGGQLGIGDSWTIIVRLVGFGLLAFAALLVVIAAAIPRRLISASLPVVAGDASWVAATVVLIAMGSFSTRGAVVTGVVGVVVLGFAVLQWRARVGSLTAVEDATVRLDEMTTIEGVVFHCDVPASAEALWPVMIDHELYAKLARNLGGATAVTENGPGLVRHCSDTNGKTWSESCTLWDPGRRFSVNVHTDAADYPYPLAMMQGSWGVAPTGRPGTSEVTMAFAFQPTPGVKGAIMALGMNATIRPILRRIARGWKRAATSSAD